MFRLHQCDFKTAIFWLRQNFSINRPKRKRRLFAAWKRKTDNRISFSLKYMAIFISSFQGFNILSEFVPIIIHRYWVSHDHVELACVKGQIPKDFHLLFHVRHFMVFQSGYQMVFLDFDPKSQLFQNVLDEMHAPELPVGCLLYTSDAADE